jgi:hypothetical protein
MTRALLAGALAACALSTVAAAAPAPSADPYTASLAYAQCMRAQGVPHPDPDRSGDFRLTPAQEQRMRAVAASVRRAADKACFHHLKGLNNQPLSRNAQKRALSVLRQLRRCIAGFGFEVGPPVVQNKSRGRAFFGFESGPRMSKALQRAQHTCEQRVRLSDRLDQIIADDRSGL